ncbi:respiratory chain complex I subunit 1 family protein [Acidocella sp. MX-AZ02]|uniref:respiratory chain complex I subunit 1 family protein n=1 Tax=Acidocella sp. MX-AZ02 TaxID=1214225 RepID=UPI00028CADEF|nr:NADH-quinone oxidoreductase subunit H [Acidocella sp. MX-AZ02]EKM98691.1 respiratory-chain NADH dehydrogenase subunit 1 [Acidocella sp. MX-AZ02]
MLGFTLAFIATGLHVALCFAVAPLLIGTTNKLRAWLLGRRGPPLLLPYWHLAKLLRKSTVLPDTATDLFTFWPLGAMLAMAVSVMLIPGFSTGLLTGPAADAITIVGLFALARAATMLGGLETGAGFGGAGAAREALFGIFAEGALLVLLLAFALLARTTNIDGIANDFRAAHLGISVSLGFALAAMLAVALTEAGRIPTDNPSGHLELAMVHEAMALDYSGRLLALLDYAGVLRLLAWMNLIGTIFLPFGMARAGDVLSWPLGLVLWALKLAVMAVALCLFEVSRAKMRVFRVPEFLGAALLLGMLASVFLFVAARIGA